MRSALRATLLFVCACGAAPAADPGLGSLMGDPQPTGHEAPVATSRAPTSEAPPGSERAKIDRLIELVRTSKLTFVRNGKDYAAADAADHLSSKLQQVSDSKMTARDFIDRIASSSSQSGEPYMLRSADGKTTPAHDWLVARLAEIESAVPAK